ncbi:MAG: hypothetical protein K0R61_4560 [Microvirga sp.]|nr:hypothetical protein [Microvirga sp.]
MPKEPTKLDKAPKPTLEPKAEPAEQMLPRNIGVRFPRRGRIGSWTASTEGCWRCSPSP